MSTGKTTPASVVKVDLRDGCRIEVTPMIRPAGQFGATLQTRVRSGDRWRWKDVKHPVVVSTFPAGAMDDLLSALVNGVLPGIEVSG